MVQDDNVAKAIFCFVFKHNVFIIRHNNIFEYLRKHIKWESRPLNVSTSQRWVNQRLWLLFIIVWNCKANTSLPEETYSYLTVVGTVLADVDLSEFDQTVFFILENISKYHQYLVYLGKMSTRILCVSQRDALLCGHRVCS